MFDARTLKALAPGEHATSDEAPGLRCVATAARRSWVYRYKSPVDGRMRQIKLGEWPAMSVGAALAAWEQARNARSQGADLQVDRRRARRDRVNEAAAREYTVRALCDDFMEGLSARVGDKHRDTTGRILRLPDLAAIERQPARDVTRAQAFDVIHGMRSRPVLAARMRQLLGAAWDRALDAGRLPPDTPNWWRLVLKGALPASKGRLVQGQRVAAKRSLSEAEVGALLRWMPNFSRDVQDALALQLWTGMRGTEVVSLRRRYVQADGDGHLWATLPAATLKMRNNPRTVDLRVPLVGRARSIVERRLQAYPEDYLFPSRGNSNAPHLRQKALGLAVWLHMPYSQTDPSYHRARLPVTHWSPHDLRRTARTMLAAMGCPAEVAEAIIGHMPSGIEGVYNRHRYDAERLHWLTRLAERLESLAAG